MFSVIKLRFIRLKDDYLVFVMMTAMALGLTFIFGTLMGQYQPTVLIVDEDRSIFSQMFTDEMKDWEGFSFKEADYPSALKAVEEGSALTSLVIKKGFAEDINKGNVVSIGMIKVKDDIDIITLEQLISGTASKMIGSKRIAEITAEFIGAYQGDSKKEAISLDAYDRVMEGWKYRNPVTVAAETMDLKNNNQYDNMKHSMIGFSGCCNSGGLDQYGHVGGMHVALGDCQFQDTFSFGQSDTSEMGDAGNGKNRKL